MPTLATLNGTSLPVQFSYRLPVMAKRQNLFQTYRAVVLQYIPYLVDSDGMIAWEVSNACISEYSTMYGLYHNATNPTYTFNGYWGDSYTVKFSTLDEPEIRSRLISYSGSFQVISILSYV